MELANEINKEVITEAHALLLEEMALAMIGIDEYGAKLKADFIREKIGQIFVPEYPEMRFTVSAGVASSRKLKDYGSLFKAADRALYASKEEGRNRVTAYSDLPKESVKM